MKKNQTNLICRIFFLIFFISQHALSLELGKITVHSQLQEPLKAEIQLVIDKKESLSNTSFKLGSDELYQRLGVEKNLAADTLDFKLLKNQNGEDVLFISSANEVTDGFFDLLINVNDGKKNVIREIIFYVNEGSAGTKKIAKTDLSKNKLNSVIIKSTADTVFKIARENQIQGISRAQMIAAIYNLNPNAFEKNDINQLKVGSTITLPEQDYFKNLSSEAAISEIKNLTEKMPVNTSPVKVEKIVQFTPPKKNVEKAVNNAPLIQSNDKKIEALDRINAFEEKINALEEKLNEVNRINKENRLNEENEKNKVQLNSEAQYENAPIHQLIQPILNVLQVNGSSKVIIIFSLSIILFLSLITVFLFIRIIQNRKMNDWKKNMNRSYEENLKKTTKFSHHMPIKKSSNETEKQKPKNWRFY